MRKPAVSHRCTCLQTNTVTVTKFARAEQYLAHRTHAAAATHERCGSNGCHLAPYQDASAVVAGQSCSSALRQACCTISKPGHTEHCCDRDTAQCETSTEFIRIVTAFLQAEALPLTAVGDVIVRQYLLHALAIILQCAGSLARNRGTQPSLNLCPHHPRRPGEQLRLGWQHHRPFLGWTVERITRPSLGGAASLIDAVPGQALKAGVTCVCKYVSKQWKCACGDRHRWQMEAGSGSLGPHLDSEWPVTDRTALACDLLQCGLFACSACLAVPLHMYCCCMHMQHQCVQAVQATARRCACAAPVSSPDAACCREDASLSCLSDNDGGHPCPFHGHPFHGPAPASSSSAPTTRVELAKVPVVKVAQTKVQTQIRVRQVLHEATVAECDTVNKAPLCKDTSTACQGSGYQLITH
jgi:hypothetical protein